MDGCQRLQHALPVVEQAQQGQPTMPQYLYSVYSVQYTAGSMYVHCTTLYSTVFLKQAFTRTNVQVHSYPTQFCDFVEPKLLNFCSYPCLHFFDIFDPAPALLYSVYSIQYCSLKMGNVVVIHSTLKLHYKSKQIVLKGIFSVGMVFLNHFPFSSVHIFFIKKMSYLSPEPKTPRPSP